MHKTVMLAFTGGLQSSVCLHWLAKKRGQKVYVLFVELMPGSNTCGLAEEAVKLGAVGAHVEDCSEEFISDYAFRALRASAVYERRYLLSGALTRPLVAEVLTRRAIEDGVKCVALATCSNSNDAARFVSNVTTLAPGLDIMHPSEIPPLENRESALKYAQRNNIKPFEGRGAEFSYDINLWGAALAVEPEVGTWEPLPEKYYYITASPENAPDQPQELVIEFEKGTPVSIDGVSMGASELVECLNSRAGKHGIGRDKVGEDRMFGLKSREIYEAPAAYTLMEAHSALEELCMDYETLQMKGDIGRFYAELVYRGGWFKKLREAYDAFVDVLQENVNGSVRLRMYRGNITVTGRSSPDSLHDGEKGAGSLSPSRAPVNYLNES